MSLYEQYDSTYTYLLVCDKDNDEFGLNVRFFVLSYTYS